jgi:hypothetical protein
MSLARNSAIAAMSSAVPRRRTGIVRFRPSTNCSAPGVLSSTLRKRGVSIEPGAMTLARTLGPYSTAICFVRRTRPAFAAP